MGRDTVKIVVRCGGGEKWSADDEWDVGGGGCRWGGGMVMDVGAGRKFFIGSAWWGWLGVLMVKW